MDFKSKLLSFSNFFKKIFCQKFFIILFSGYLLVNIIVSLCFGEEVFSKQTVIEINIFIILGSTIFFSVVFFMICHFIEKIKFFRFLHRFIFLGLSLIYAFCLIFLREKDIYFTLSVIGIMFIIVIIFFGEKELHLPKDLEDNNKTEKKLISDKVLIIIICMFFIGFVIYISFSTIIRLRTFGASAFDFGIFAQMFENMAKTGLPLTTVERNMELSHFAVHFSPVYYLFLPFYMIVRTPEYLLVLQAVFIGMGVLPLVLICKKLNIKNEIILFVSASYLLNPMFAGGAFFDFHENIFLTFFLLFLFYFMITDKQIPMYIFAALTLSVKEDAFIYVITAALFLMFNRKKLLHGFILCIASIVYFIIVSNYMHNFGLGIMDNRFDDYLIYESDRLFQVVINVLENPSLLIKNLLNKAKMEFLIGVFLPVSFLCFTGKNGIKNIYLLIPLVIVNLATNYPYQHQIGFQYIYGSVAFVFLMVVLNINDMKKKFLSIALVMSVISSLFIFTNTYKDQIYYFQNVYFSYGESFTRTRQLFKDLLPSNAVVSASTYLISQMLHVEELYVVGTEFEDIFEHDAEYIVTDLRMIDFDRYNRILAMLKNRGYVKIDSADFVEIFHLQNEPTEMFEDY